MAKLTPQQIADVVQKAGFTGEHKSRGYRDDAVAVAVAMCESGGDTTAVGDGDGNEKFGDPSTGDSLGLFQIHQPTWSGQFMYRGTEWFDAPNNAAAAYSIYKSAGRKFTDWTCYKSGGYLRHLPKAIKAVGDPQESPDVRSSDSVAQQAAEAVPGVREMVEFVQFITNKDNWRRVSYFVGGGAILIVATMLFMQESGIAKQAANVIPVGRVAKAAGKLGKAGKAASAARKVAS